MGYNMKVANLQVHSTDMIHPVLFFSDMFDLYLDLILGINKTTQW